MNDLGTVMDVTAWIPEEDEQLGARDKVWLKEDASEASPWWLFKEPRSRGLPELGADLWAEVIAGAVAPLLSVPAVEVRFAVFRQKRGIISRRVDGTLVHGNELLWLRNSAYAREQRGPVAGYDLDSIAEVLNGYGGSEPGLSAADRFAGYLMFDALIGNTDRHHENWAVVAETHTLAPSYDHGASLGFNVPPQRRGQVELAADRGTARHFPGRPPLVGLAREALSRADQAVSAVWLERLSALDLVDVTSAVEQIPASSMSEGTRTFVVDFIATNQRRLLQ